MKIISKGIDISRWQGDFDLAQANAEGFEFAIIKGGGGDAGLYTDKQFARNYEKAKALGMPTGCYWFSKALSVEEAVREADYFHEHCLNGRQFELPVYMDVEHRAQLDLGKDKLTAVIHAFCQRLEELGYWVGIYSSQSYFSSYMHDSELQCYAHWVACWGTDCGYDGSSFGMWQYGGEVNKICSNKVADVVCDQNYMLVDYPTLIKKAGRNGFRAAQEEPEETPTEPEKIPEPPGIWAEGMAVDIHAAGNVTPAMLYDFFDTILGEGSELVLCDWGVRVGISETKKRFKG